MADNVAPFTAQELAFFALHTQIYDQVNILKCAWYALDASAAVDADTPASEARSVIFNCEQKLRQLTEQLEGWDVEHGAGARIRSKVQIDQQAA
jgi:hypothetical protein